MARSPQAVADHYKRPALGDVILTALKAAGKDIEHLTPDDLAPVDEFHSGGRNATVRLAQLSQIRNGERVLDVGCGIGGPSRYLASQLGCQVTGLDFTAEFVAPAEMLARRTRLADKVAYRQGDALDLPFPDGSFDVVWSQNAAMNIADRDRLYSEMRRVLTPAGRERIGFRVLVWQDTTEEALQQQTARTKAIETGSLPPLGLHILIGEAFPTVTKNMLRNLQEERLKLFNAVLQRV
jgi:ubiquinone/menaquinone biosynthesis C-methylase UbiE